MKESVAIAKDADRKKDFSPTKSDNSIQRLRNEPERQLGSLRGVIGNITRNGGTPSVDSIATELSSVHSAQRAPALLALQRTHGNRYVQRVVTGIQAKLKVGQLGDKYEQEADRVAEKVMRMPEPEVQREAEEGEREEEEEEILQTKEVSGYALGVSPDIESRINEMKGGGQLLPESVRAFFESHFGHDFSQIPVHASVQRSIQPKLKVGAPGDKYEREADQVAARVVQQRVPVGGNYGKAGNHSRRFQLFIKGERENQTNKQIGAEPGTYNLKFQIEPGSRLGKPLDTSTKEEMSRKIGFDFSNVRVHTDDLSIYTNKGLNARAFTHGSDIYFNEGEYNPNSLGGKKLLAHELTHVVQQSRMTDKTAQRRMIQCTSIGQILDNFFSPFSSETLWVMPETDNYTRIVRRWQPVIDAVNQAKADLEANCANWRANHMTDSSWTPGMTDPPVTDPNAYDEHPRANGIWVSSPPGTDPGTCRNAFIVYVATKANPQIPTVQTFELYTCSIGSFGIYATVDSIDCAARTAQMNIWMYNAMDQGSFGSSASHPLFALSGMERQYMWWNWSESHSWGPPAPAPTPTPTPAPAPAPPTTHTVVRGDTMSAIASRYGVSLGDLVAANPQVRNPNLIHPGDVLTLP